MSRQSIPLKEGDRVVTAFQHNGRIVIVTEYGDTFYLHIDDWEDPTSFVIKRVY